jgi:hypothetical protein
MADNPRHDWAVLAALASNRAAGRLFVFLAEHCGDADAVVCSIETIAAALDLSTRTVHRAVADLEAGGHIERATVGKMLAFIVRPAAVWAAAEDEGEFYSIDARVLIGKAQNPGIKLPPAAEPARQVYVITETVTANAADAPSGAGMAFRFKAKMPPADKGEGA